MYPTNRNRVWEGLRTSWTDGLHVLIRICIMSVRDRGSLATQWPRGPLWTPGLGPRGWLVQITYPTWVYFQSTLSKCLSHGYVLIKWLCNKHRVTNNASRYGWLALVTPWDSQTPLPCPGIAKTAQLHLAFRLWVQVFLVTIINGCRTKAADELVSRDPLSLDLLF